MNIAVIGTGYVGLVTGACFAEFGVKVTCVDKEADKIARLQRGEIPIYEPGLEEIVRRNMKAERLTFTTDLKEAVSRSLVVFIAVGTPQSKTGEADLSYVRAVAEEIGAELTDDEYLRISAAHEVHPGAYEVYLIGHHYLNIVTAEGLFTAVEHF